MAQQSVSSVEPTELFKLIRLGGEAEVEACLEAGQSVQVVNHFGCVFPAPPNVDHTLPYVPENGGPFAQ